MKVTFGPLQRCKQCVEVYKALFFLGYTMETKTESSVYCELWTEKGATTCNVSWELCTYSTVITRLLNRDCNVQFPRTSTCTSYINIVGLGEFTYSLSVSERPTFNNTPQQPRQILLVSFPGVFTVQFLITCSIQKWRGETCE